MIDIRTDISDDVRTTRFGLAGTGAGFVVVALNRILDEQSRIIHECGGDIDKFVGDEIFAVFTGEDGARRACKAALAIIGLCASRTEEFDGLSVGIGITEGMVIHGMMGSTRRADFTMIEDPVNTASRLCSLAKGGQILVSTEMRNAAVPAFTFAGPYRAKLKGKTDPQAVRFLRTESGRES